MRAIVQRVSGATVSVDGREVGRCGYGLLVLVGVRVDDSAKESQKLADKVAHLRIFRDEAGKMNLSLMDFSGEYDVLAISNFTVYGDTKKNRRPSFVEAASYEQGAELFQKFVDLLQQTGIGVQTGVFGAHMQVALVNDGPVTVIVDV